MLLSNALKSLFIVSLCVLTLSSNASYISDWFSEDITPDSDEEYFQHVANRWINTINSTSPAVLNRESYGTGKEILQPGDTLLITIADLPEYSKGPVQTVILKSGEITVPPFGTYPVSGLSLQQVSQMLEEMAGYYLKHPKVFVILKEKSEEQQAAVAE